MEKSGNGMRDRKSDDKTLFVVHTGNLKLTHVEFETYFQEWESVTHFT